MTKENSQLHEVDLDKTDKLPILEGVTFDPDVADDAVRMDHASRPRGPGSGSVHRRTSSDHPSICRRWPKACVRLRNASLVRTPSWRR